MGDMELISKKRPTFVGKCYNFCGAYLQGHRVFGYQDMSVYGWTDGCINTKWATESCSPQAGSTKDWSDDKKRAPYGSLTYKWTIGNSDQQH